MKVYLQWRKSRCRATSGDQEHRAGYCDSVVTGIVSEIGTGGVRTKTGFCVYSRSGTPKSEL